jgi:hypothetical protein
MTLGKPKPKPTKTKLQKSFLNNTNEEDFVQNIPKVLADKRANHWLSIGCMNSMKKGLGSGSFNSNFDRSC